MMATIKPNDNRNRVFIGSDTILVAPVELEDDSFTAAGSVITEKVRNTL